MNFKKSPVFLITLLLISFAGHTQVKFGAKINVGASWISSGNLEDNFAFQLSNDADIRSWNVSNFPGVLFGIGAVAQYELKENLSLQAALSVDYQQSQVNIQYIEDSRTTVGNGTVERINSEASISSTRFALPVTINYSLGEYGTVLLSGFELNFVGTPEIESVETESVEVYQNNSLIEQHFDAEAITAELDQFSTARFNFLLGGGKAFDLGGNEFQLHLKYHIPITGSPMYNSTNSTLFDDNTTKNNEIFGALGKIDAEQDAPQFPLDDFKMYFFDISLTYLF